MNITKEAVEVSLSSDKKCTVYKDKYVLLHKSFDVKDDQIDNYIKRIKDINEKEINTPLILDYYVVSKKENGYSDYIILEERAPGRNLDAESIFINLKEKYDFSEVSSIYLNALDDYINEIIKRAYAPDEMYEKFVSDYYAIINCGLMVDPKPLNFYFDSDKGFTFIDINSGGKDDISYLPRYFLGAVLGYGVPNIYIENINSKFIDKGRLSKINNAFNVIISKVSKALLKYDFTEQDILKAAENWQRQIDNYIVIDNIESLSDRLEANYNKAIEKSNKEQDDDEWSIKW